MNSIYILHQTPSFVFCDITNTAHFSHTRTVDLFIFKLTMFTYALIRLTLTVSFHSDTAETLFWAEWPAGAAEYE